MAVDRVDQAALQHLSDADVGGVDRLVVADPDEDRVEDARARELTNRAPTVLRRLQDHALDPIAGRGLALDVGHLDLDDDLRADEAIERPLGVRVAVVRAHVHLAELLHERDPLLAGHVPAGADHLVLTVLAHQPHQHRADLVRALTRLGVADDRGVDVDRRLRLVDDRVVVGADDEAFALAPRDPLLEELRDRGAAGDRLGLDRLEPLAGVEEPLHRLQAIGVLGHPLRRLAKASGDRVKRGEGDPGGLRLGLAAHRRGEVADAGPTTLARGEELTGEHGPAVGLRRGRLGLAEHRDVAGDDPPGRRGEEGLAVVVDEEPHLAVDLRRDQVLAGVEAVEVLLDEGAVAARDRPLVAADHRRELAVGDAAGWGLLTCPEGAGAVSRVEAHGGLLS